MAKGPRDFIDPNKMFPDSLRFMENSILMFLQQLFATFPPKQEQCRFHYNDSPSVTEIEISGRNVDNLKNVDTRPHIVVARGPMQWSDVGLGNFVGGQNLSMQSSKFVGFYTGTVGISCFSREELEADWLATICSDSLKFFRPIIQKYGFLEIKVAQIGARGIVKSDAKDDLCVTPVVVKVSVTKNWNLSKLDPVKLREVIVQYTLTGTG